MRFKDLYDQDKDGKLNREEQLRWVAPNSYGSAREEVRPQNEIYTIFLSFNTWACSVFGCSFSYCLVGLYTTSLHDGMAAYSLISIPCFALMSSTGSSPHQGDGPRWGRTDLRGRSFEKSRDIHEQ